MNLLVLMFMAQVIMSSPLTGQIIVVGATAEIYEEVIVVQKNLVGTVLTDADGNFSFDLPPGDYTVEAQDHQGVPVRPSVTEVTIE